MGTRRSRGNGEVGATGSACVVSKARWQQKYIVATAQYDRVVYPHWTVEGWLCFYADKDSERSGAMCSCAGSPDTGTVS